MSFLETLTANDISNGPLPIDGILKNSLYYPACEFDRNFVRLCNTDKRDLGIISYIYCDYPIGKDRFLEKQNTFHGYGIFGSRSVDPKELVPNGWTLKLLPGMHSEDYLKYKRYWQKPFAIWTVYQRDANRGEEHGPKRFSLLYLCGEGVATYQALYWSNRKTPRALVIWHPGTGFGLNWTDFRHRKGPLAWVVNENQAGIPEFVFHDSSARSHEDFHWDNYCLDPITTNLGMMEELLVYRRKKI